MGRSLKDLAKSMRERAKGLDTLASDVSKAGSEAMLRELVEVTPVDTSTALSNWQVGIGVPVANDIPAVAEGRYGSTRGASADKTVADGLQKLQSKRPGETIFLSNLTPYIGDLDDGTSRQFAGGFVPRALIVFRLAVKDAKKRLLR